MGKRNEWKRHLYIGREHIITLVAVLIFSAVAVSCPPCKKARNANQVARRSRAAIHLIRDKEKWAGIPAGQFMMGSPLDEAGRVPDRIYGHSNRRKHDWEKQHRVTLTRNFLLKRTEVTQGEFKAIMGYNPSRYPLITFRQEDLKKAEYKVVLGKQLPTNFVSWYEAAAFCNALSKAAGLSSCYKCLGKGRKVRCHFAKEQFQTPYKCPGYRLPTEAEWEYAARACTTTETYNGDRNYQHKACEEIEDPVLEPIAWTCSNSKQRVHKVGIKKPNAWGLHDMLGNIDELCHDWCADKVRKDTIDPWQAKNKLNRIITRGGCFNCPINETRAASINCYPPGNQTSLVGFRPARTILSEPQNRLLKEIETKRRKCLGQKEKRKKENAKKVNGGKKQKKKPRDVEIKINKKDLEALKRYDL